MSLDMSLDLSPEQFGKISETVRSVAGIRLPPGKETLVRSRLSKRLRALGLNGFEAYLDHIHGDESGGELAEMVDALTTNKTSFFRESVHFDFLIDTVVPTLEEQAAPKVWSAGCATGEEPYTLAMVLAENLPAPLDRKARILATDISAHSLAVARAASYTAAVVAGIPDALREKYLRTTPGGRYVVTDRLKAMTRFAQLNLMGTWPMRGPFDVIFCRNVMIYFDRETRERLVARFHSLLREGGYLFVGHSESLTGLAHDFTYVQPAVYRR
jgi:chemotaxis protein methyltransferase CheR